MRGSVVTWRKKKARRAGLLWESDLFFDVPDEGAEAELGALFIEGLEFGEDYGHTVVFDDGDDGTCHRGPGV